MTSPVARRRNWAALPGGRETRGRGRRHQLRRRGANGLPREDTLGGDPDVRGALKASCSTRSIPARRAAGLMRLGAARGRFQEGRACRVPAQPAAPSGLFALQGRAGAGDENGRHSGRHGAGGDGAADCRRSSQPCPRGDDADHVPLIVDQNRQVPSRIAHLIEGTGPDPAGTNKTGAGLPWARPLEAAGGARPSRLAVQHLSERNHSRYGRRSGARCRFPFYSYMVAASGPRGAGNAAGQGAAVGLLRPRPPWHRWALFDRALADGGAARGPPRGRAARACLAAIRSNSRRTAPNAECAAAAGSPPHPRVASGQRGARVQLIARATRVLPADPRRARAHRRGQGHRNTLDVPVAEIVEFANIVNWGPHAQGPDTAAASYIRLGGRLAHHPRPTSRSFGPCQRAWCGARFMPTVSRAGRPGGEALHPVHLGAAGFHPQMAISGISVDADARAPPTAPTSPATSRPNPALPARRPRPSRRPPAPDRESNCPLLQRRHTANVGSAVGRWARARSRRRPRGAPVRSLRRTAATSSSDGSEIGSATSAVSSRPSINSPISRSVWVPAHLQVGAGVARREVAGSRPRQRR